jgi:hypothetical protein
MRSRGRALIEADTAGEEQNADEGGEEDNDPVHAVVLTDVPTRSKA